MRWLPCVNFGLSILANFVRFIRSLQVLVVCIQSMIGVHALVNDADALRFAKVKLVSKCRMNLQQSTAQ